MHISLSGPVFFLGLLLSGLFIMVFTTVHVLQVYVIVVEGHFWWLSPQAGRPSSGYFLLFGGDPSDFCKLGFWNSCGGGIHWHIVWVVWGESDPGQSLSGFPGWLRGPLVIGGSFRKVPNVHVILSLWL